jgi:tetratricopeptide (TPR) repeat protein
MLMSMFIGPPEDLDLADMEAFRREDLSPWVSALTHMGPGFVWFNLGEQDLARNGFQLGLEGFRALGDRWGITLALSGLSDLDFEEGDYEGALALVEEALALSEQLGSDADVSEYLCRRADCLIHMGDATEAAACYRRAAELSRRAGSPESLSRAILGLGELALKRGELEQAGELISQALVENPSDWYTGLFIQYRVELAFGELALARGDLPGARERYLGLLRASLEGQLLPTAAKAAEGLAEVARREGSAELAERLLTVSPAQALEIVSAR